MSHPACDHAGTPKPPRPVPDWTGTCPSCGERVKHDGRGGFVTVREVNERIAQRVHLVLDPNDAAVVREALWHSLMRADVPDDDRERMHVIRQRCGAVNR